MVFYFKILKIIIIKIRRKRRQRVKIGEAFSDWLPVNAGVPQGTKLGPILFLIMINDLSIPTPETNLWKFVEDVSISECLTKNGGASIQSTLDTVSSWASMNLMKLNARKCKELRVCFFKATPQLPPLQQWTTTRNSSFAQGFRFGYPGQSEMERGEHLYDCIQGIQASAHYPCST